MKRAIVIGAGPAGLTASYELLQRTEIRPLVLEASEEMGGLSRTVKHRGNRIDIGGHRFFSKSDRVMRWWLEMLPLESVENPDRVMLVRQRLSRIYFLRKFFSYPIALSWETILQLGLWRTFRIGASYLRAVAFPIRDEKTLEQFFINRFGRELYATFFRDYTEKVWGVPCSQIGADWGAQRVKGLSIRKALAHALRSAFSRGKDIGQKSTETSLIERFLYPKFGPGQMWEEVARRILAGGGEIRTGCVVDSLERRGGRIVAVGILHTKTGKRERIEGDIFFSTMPVKDLVRAIPDPVPPDIRKLAEGLVYRDFITVGLLVESLRSPKAGQRLEDNWIYVQEPDVFVGRLQIFNNWSPYMVADPSKTWIGLEYFCHEGDALWSRSDRELMELGAAELAKIGLLGKNSFLDGVVLRVPKTYPAYFGSYSRFGEIRSFLDGFENLYLLGRNGQHRYNNQDHAMLTAMTAVDSIVAGVTEKRAVWEVNTEQDYHEEKSMPSAQKAEVR